MPNTDLKDFYGSYIAALNTRDFETIGKFIGDEVHVNGTACKRADVIASLEDIVDAVPDFHWKVQDLLRTRTASRLGCRTTERRPSHFSAMRPPVHRSTSCNRLISCGGPPIR